MYVENLAISGKFNITKLAGICGILFPMLIIICTCLSIYVSPWFIWTQNALSDLGVKGISAFIFNNGLILAGIFALVFSIGIAKTLSNKFGAYVFAISAIALIGTGLFPLNLFVLHYVSSLTFFITLILSLFIIGFTLKNSKIEYKLGVATIFFAIIACISLILLKFLEGIAIPEVIVCIPPFIWCMTYGLKLVKNEQVKKIL